MPSLIRPLLLTLAGTLASAATSPGAPGDAGVAIVRRDGSLQPLARLSGDEWRPLTPGEAAGAWRLWLFDDPALAGSPFATRTARPVTATEGHTGCLRIAGLDAAVLAAAGPAGAARVGVAVSGSDIRPDIPVLVAVDSDLGRTITARAAAAFHRAEDETLTLEAEELPAGFPRFADRRQRPITWTRIARQGSAQAAAKTYYLEGSKDYEGFRGRTDIGRIRTTGHVFVQMARDRETIDAEVDLSDLDDHQSMFRTPLAVLAWPTRAAWVFATRGPGGTHLEILELTSATSQPRSVWQGPDGCERGTP